MDKKPPWRSKNSSKFRRIRKNNCPFPVKEASKNLCIVSSTRNKQAESARASYRCGAHNVFTPRGLSQPYDAVYKNTSWLHYTEDFLKRARARTVRMVISQLQAISAICDMFKRQ